jgi:hypothetical protein
VHVPVIPRISQKDGITVYEQNLREYLEWTKLTYVDQIDKDHLFAYRKHVMDGGNERLTADWKLLRINKMVKATLRLDHGKGPIKKSDLGKMKPNGDPDIYTPQELRAFFGVCKPDEHLRHSWQEGDERCISQRHPTKRSLLAKRTPEWTLPRPPTLSGLVPSREAPFLSQSAYLAERAFSQPDMFRSA